MLSFGSAPRAARRALRLQFRSSRENAGRASSRAPRQKVRFVRRFPHNLWFEVEDAARSLGELRRTKETFLLPQSPPRDERRARALVLSSKRGKASRASLFQKKTRRINRLLRRRPRRAATTRAQSAFAEKIVHFVGVFLAQIRRCQMLGPFTMPSNDRVRGSSGFLPEKNHRFAKIQRTRARTVARGLSAYERKKQKKPPPCARYEDLSLSLDVFIRLLSHAATTS